MIRTNKKTHTHLTRGVVRKSKKQNIHLSHAHSNSTAAAFVDCFAAQQHGQGTHSTDKSSHDHSNSWGSLLRSGETASTRESTPAPAPAPVAQVVQRGPLPRVEPLSVELERFVGPKARQSYSTATKLRVIDYTRLPCIDGGVVVIAERRPGWDRGCVRSGSGNGFKPGTKIAKRQEARGGKVKKNLAGRVSTTQDVEGVRGLHQLLS